MSVAHVALIQLYQYVIRVFMTYERGCLFVVYLEKEPVNWCGFAFVSITGNTP